MEIARIGIDGDLHLSSKNRGAHNDYPQESLMYLNYATDIFEKNGCTHIVNLGDIEYGRFGTLEYRGLVEQAFKRRRELTKGHFYIVKGNHDSATYGMTEYEFYLGKGAFKGSSDLDIGKTKLFMCDFGGEDREFPIDSGKTNIVLGHNYFMFKDTLMPNFGDPIVLDERENFFGVDYIFSGHIHQEYVFSGIIARGGIGHRCIVHQLPCLARPEYLGDRTPEKGAVIVLRVYDDKEPEAVRLEFPLLPIEQSFNLALKNKQDADSMRKHVDVSSVVKGLAEFEREIGDTESYIKGLVGVKAEYKEKALELLKAGEEE